MAKLTGARVAELSVRALRAGVDNNSDRLEATLRTLLTEGDDEDALRWTLAMIGTSNAEVPRRSDLPPDQRDRLVPVPEITTTGLDGIERRMSIDDAPLGVATYARLCAAWVDEDGAQAVAVWRAMLVSDTDRLEATSRCMNMAFEAAVVAARRGIGGLQ